MLPDYDNNHITIKIMGELFAFDQLANIAHN